VQKANLPEAGLTLRDPENEAKETAIFGMSDQETQSHRSRHLYKKDVDRWVATKYAF
jgi:hypothetical protein